MANADVKEVDHELDGWLVLPGSYVNRYDHPAVDKMRVRLNKVEKVF